MENKDKASTQSSEYWSSYYNGLSLEFPPSQFAAFTAGELSEQSSDCLIIDLGGGNGRDLKFFDRQGYNTIYVDQVFGLGSFQSVPILLGNIISSDLWVKIKRIVNAKSHDKIVVFYIRFVFHCLREEELIILLNFIKESSSHNKIKVFVEYRSDKDELRPKVTPPHERFFHSNSVVDMILKSLGYRTIYEVEGIGFAKYLNDDAYVRRLILEL